MKTKLIKFSIYAVCILTILAVSYFAVAALYFAICNVFDWVFSWKKVIWIWLAIFLFNCTIRGIKTE